MRLLRQCDWWNCAAIYISETILYETCLRKYLVYIKGFRVEMDICKYTVDEVLTMIFDSNQYKVILRNDLLDNEYPKGDRRVFICFRCYCSWLFFQTRVVFNFLLRLSFFWVCFLWKNGSVWFPWAPFGSLGLP